MKWKGQDRSKSGATAEIYVLEKISTSREKFIRYRRESIIFNDDCSCFSQLVYGKWNFLAAEIFALSRFMRNLQFEWAQESSEGERWNRNNNNKLNLISFYLIVQLLSRSLLPQPTVICLNPLIYSLDDENSRQNSEKHSTSRRQRTTVQFNTPANSEIYCNLSSFSVGSPLLSGCYQT